jgi:hypothetical protein
MHCQNFYQKSWDRQSVRKPEEQLKKNLLGKITFANYRKYTINSCNGEIISHMDFEQVQDLMVNPQNSFIGTSLNVSLFSKGLSDENRYSRILQGMIMG